jgi:hypothetical protein
MDDIVILNMAAGVTTTLRIGPVIRMQNTLFMICACRTHDDGRGGRERIG